MSFRLREVAIWDLHFLVQAIPRRPKRASTRSEWFWQGFSVTQMRIHFTAYSIHTDRHVRWAGLWTMEFKSASLPFHSYNPVHSSSAPREHILKVIDISQHRGKKAPLQKETHNILPPTMSAISLSRRQKQYAKRLQFEHTATDLLSWNGALKESLAKAMKYSSAYIYL